MFLYKCENCELSVSICEEPRYVLIFMECMFFCSLLIVVILNNSSIKSNIPFSNLQRN